MLKTYRLLKKAGEFRRAMGEALFKEMAPDQWCKHGFGYGFCPKEDCENA